MYPRLSDLFLDWFGVSLPIPIYSFGFMVAAAIMLGGWLIQREIDRLYGLGRVAPIRVKAESKGKGSKRERMVDASPGQLVGTLTVLAVVGGFAGAKLFHILENLDEFVLAPGRMVFSSGGFTFYGGLIVAALLIVWYLRRNGQSPAIFADAFAPGLILGYGVGRIGCHLSGDGDWGIPADVAAKPDWIPMWLWAEDYANNILGRDLSAAPVYPTSLYEFGMAVVLFAVLYSLRDHPFRAGWLFGLYFIFAGVERFVIELIRVNNTGTILGIEMTQAQFISVILVLVGAFIMVRTGKRASGEGGVPVAGVSAASAPQGGSQDS